MTFADFLDQQPHVATTEECLFPWSGGKDGKHFRCYLCGHRFVPGDTYRFLFNSQQSPPHLLVCDKCDGGDVLARFREMRRIAEKTYWWAFK